MRPGSIKGLAAAAIACGLLSLSLAVRPTLGGDEPRGLGRLFRMGGSNSSNPATADPSPATGPATASQPSGYYGQPALSTPPGNAPGSLSGPKVTPKARVTKPATEADPIVTRVSLGRSDDGTQFSMFLQVYADGTVIDNSGVHKVGADALKPVVEAIGSGDLARVKGHCGGPAGDFVESVYVVVYDRSMGRLRANSFSYSGSTQGCDHAVRHLQTVLESLQAKVSTMSPAPAPVPAAAATAPTQGSLASPPLPLTTVP